MMSLNKDQEVEMNSLHRRLDDYADYVAAREKLRDVRRDLNDKTGELKRLQLARARQFTASEVEQIEAAKASYLAGEPIPDLRTLDEAIARLEHEADVVGAVFRDQAAVVAELKAAAETEIIGEARPRHRRLVVNIKHAVEELMTAVAAEAAFRAALERDGVQPAALRALVNLLPSAVTGQGFGAPLPTFLRDVDRQMEN